MATTFACTASALTSRQVLPFVFPPLTARYSLSLRSRASALRFVLLRAASAPCLASFCPVVYARAPHASRGLAPFRYTASGVLAWPIYSMPFNDTRVYQKRMP